MSEKDRCLTVVEEMELNYRMLERVNKIYEGEIAQLRKIKNEQEGKIKVLAKENAKLKMDNERWILRYGSK